MILLDCCHTLTFLFRVRNCISFAHGNEILLNILSSGLCHDTAITKTTLELCQVAPNKSYQNDRQNELLLKVPKYIQDGQRFMPPFSRQGHIGTACD